MRLTENVTFVPNDDSFLLMPLKTNFKAENGRERKRERARGREKEREKEREIEREKEIRREQGRSIISVQV